MRRPSALLVLRLLVALPAALPAQVVSGVVLEEVSQLPVAGGLTQLLDGRGVAASAVTDERGRFTLPPVVPGSYRLRALRIGFRPWTSDSFTLRAGEARSFTLRVPAIAVVLDEIVVEGTSACRARPESDRRVALLWDAARTSLGLLGGGRGDLEFRGTLTRRRLDPQGRVNHLDTYPSLGQGAWPVTSQAPDSLAQLGFVQPRDTVQGPIYYGPDVRAFFSDAFLTTHCFRLVQAPRRERHLIGVGFAPARGRALPDIQGTLWLDRRNGALVRLEYRYANLWRWVPADQAGGALEFARLTDGTPIMIGWRLRAPVARRLRWNAAPDERTEPFFGPGQVILHGFAEEEGVIQEVRTAAGLVLWQRPAVPAARARVAPT